MDMQGYEGVGERATPACRRQSETHGNVRSRHALTEYAFLEPIATFFNDDFLVSADEGFPVTAFAFLREQTDLFATAFEFSGRDGKVGLPGYEPIGTGTFAAGIGEGMDVTESHFPAEVKGLAEFPGAFLRIACNYIGSEVKKWIDRADVFHSVPEVGRIVLAAHGQEYFIGAGLQAEMQMGGHFGMVQEVEEFLIHAFRLNRTKANTE